MRLYTNPISPNSRKTRAVARHLGTSIEEVHVDLAGGEQRTDAFLSRNPNGMVPLFEDGETTLFESNAISFYLAEREGSKLLPRLPHARAHVLEWLSWEGCHLAPAVLDLAFERVIKPMIGAGVPSEAIVERSLDRYARFGSVLDGQLSDGQWVLGAELTVADFCLAGCFTFAAASELPLEATPHVARWLNAMDELPAWRDTAPPRG